MVFEREITDAQQRFTAGLPEPFDRPSERILAIKAISHAHVATNRPRIQIKPVGDIAKRFGNVENLSESIYKFITNVLVPC